MTAPKKTLLCSICGRKPIVEEYRPFCSKRCADVDLGRWLKGGYAIPGAPAEEEGAQAAIDAENGARGDSEN